MKTGLLLTFIGLIIGLFTGFGFILTLVGLFMLNSENFKKSRNSFIGTLAVSIAGFFVLIGMSGVAMLALTMRSPAGVVGFIIVTIAIIIALYFFNLRSYQYLMRGCRDIAVEHQDMTLADNTDTAFRHYKNSLLASTILGTLATLFVWVPVLNILLMIATICVGVWYFVAQIFIIIRVYQTYEKEAA